MTEIHPHDRQFVEKIAYKLPDSFKRKVLKTYLHHLKHLSRREANTYLLDIDEQIKTAVVGRINQSMLNASEDDLRSLADTAAKKCLYKGRALKGQPPEMLYKAILAYMAQQNIRPAALKDEPSLSDMWFVMKRSFNKSWWLSRLRRRQNQDIETAARSLNFIKKTAEIYASDENVMRRQEQKKSQQKLLENMQATNEQGDRFLLSELKATSVSNPLIRKAELMVRCRGFEEYAKANQHTSLFITLTCPSRYHRAYSSSGDSTKNWKHETPLDAQDYLKTTFARIRAALNRENIRAYGFRVAEPNHDGTPHWHLLLFMPSTLKERLKEIFTRYALEEDGEEDGADKHRITIVKIDPNKGSATGYIAKYISKNIDGENIEFGTYGENPNEAARRIETWASVWGIRQFQQIGGPQVSIWRELRRIDPLDDPESLMELARKAADDSKWDEYLKVMGGDDCPRKERPIKLVYKQAVDIFSGVLKENQYGEIKAQSIYGLEHENVRINSRPHTWEISRAI